MLAAPVLAVAAVLVLAGPDRPTAAPTPPTVPEAAHPPVRWGDYGHEMVGRAAAETLPGDVPAFFRDRSAQLVYLNPEPDRWRSRPLREMDQAWTYDHYIDLENVPPGALDAPDRWQYLRALYESGLERPEGDGGFLPFHIVELYQRLVTEWRMWRAEVDAERRSWIEDRIVNDAGTLGHYVADAANPHHTTIHYNGWAEAAPNPEGYTTARDFHARFESEFVRAHVRYQDVRERISGAPRSVAGNARAAVMQHVLASNALVETLYRLEKDVGFDPVGPLRAETRDFAADRLAAAADMLRSLWWSAWSESATAP